MNEPIPIILPTEKLVPLDALKPIIKWRLRPSEMFPTNKVIRAGQLVLRILSTNDKKYTVSLELVGVVLENDAAFEQPPQITPQDAAQVAAELKQIEDASNDTSN